MLVARRSDAIIALFEKRNGLNQFHHIIEDSLINFHSFFQLNIVFQLNDSLIIFIRMQTNLMFVFQWLVEVTRGTND